MVYSYSIFPFLFSTLLLFSCCFFEDILSLKTFSSCCSLLCACSEWRIPAKYCNLDSFSLFFACCAFAINVELNTITQNVFLLHENIIAVEIYSAIVREVNNKRFNCMFINYFHCFENHAALSQKHIYTFI